MSIIEQLDNEGINLQETILNLENQGYKDYYDSWLKYMYMKVMLQRVSELAYKHIEATLKFMGKKK